MKLYYTLFCLMLVALFPVSAQNKAAVPQPSQRADRIINSNWTFNYFPSDAADKGYESPAYDDSKWVAVSIPHTWQTYETTGELPPSNESVADNPYWWNGWGWYRKHFAIGQAYAGRKVFIEFGDVQKYCKVWINGVYLGDHTGGYGSFGFDITQHIKKGGDNVIAVAVNNRRDDKFKMPPVAAGYYYLYGGIYDNVTIALRNNMYIPMQGSALHEGGTFITTPELDARSGLVRIQTWVKNEYPDVRNCVLLTSVYDASNKLVQQVKSAADIKQGQLYRFDQTTKPVKNPRLWSPEEPYLYKVVSEVTDGKNVIDTYTSPLGFRRLRWDSRENVLYVNGKKTLLKGGERYQEYPWLGNAIPKQLADMDLANMSEKRGCNFLNTALYPGGRKVYDLADCYGLIINEEVAAVSSPDFSPEIREKHIKEMIRLSRNHPSIMFWSIHAENKAADSKLILTEDTTRIVTDYLTLRAAIIKDGKTEPSKVLSAGEPAKIVLKASHNKIIADRASVVIIHADIVDSKGIRTHMSDKPLKWTVSGPATMVGPSLYEHGRVSQPPVANVIRSTGEAGNIRVTVFAGGIASGSVSITSEAVQPDNSVVAETVLSNEGRTGLERVVMKASRLEETPREIKLSSDPIKLTATGKAGYKKAITDLIAGSNPALDTTLVEFRALADLLATYLSNNNGQIVADDYNFNVDHYNTCRLISGYINATKLPLPFKEGLRIYYSNTLIRDGSEKDAGDEMNWLNWIPSGGTVVYYDPDAKAPSIKGTLVTSVNELPDLISLVHPGFEKFSYDARERALGFIARMNPYVRTDVKSENVDGKIVTTTRLLAEKKQPVLIPLYKFIAE